MVFTIMLLGRPLYVIYQHKSFIDFLSKRYNFSYDENNLKCLNLETDLGVIQLDYYDYIVMDTDTVTGFLNSFVILLDAYALEDQGQPIDIKVIKD